MTRLSHKIHHMLLLTMALVTAISMEAQVKIHGKITDATDQPIEFATVRIGGTAIGVTSGLEGEYSLSCAAADTITVYFSCIGYREEKKQLIDASGDVTLNVRLQLNTEVLQQVEITELKKQTGSVATIDASELRRSPDVSGGSVESLITTMAGVTSSNEMSSQYSVRGGSYDENSVYINGIEVYRPQLISSGQQEGLSIINPDLVGHRFFHRWFSRRIRRQDVIRTRHNLPRAGSVRGFGVRQPHGWITCYRPREQTSQPASRREIQDQFITSQLDGHQRRV